VILRKTGGRGFDNNIICIAEKKEVRNNESLSSSKNTVKILRLYCLVHLNSIRK